MKKMTLLLLALSMQGTAQTVHSERPYDSVDPRIGSSGEGMTSPTAQLPFGMVQWGPDTHTGEWYNYAYEDTKLLGFSLTHISGAGCRFYNDLPVLPWLGEVKENPGVAGAYALAFSHQMEKALPGYYSLQTDNGIKTELTAALRSGMGRFTFPPDSQRTLLLEAGSSATADFASAKGDISTIELSNGNSATGSLVSGHFCGGGPTYTLYFAMQFSEPFNSTGGWDAQVHPGATSASGHKAGAWVSFAKSAKPLLMKIGISYVGVANARHNLEEDVREADGGAEFETQFEAMRKSAEKTWSAALGRIEIAGGTPDRRTVFYTGLYHALLSPNVFSDANGDYIDFNGKAQRLKPGEAQYTNFSDWDTLRTVVQLQSLLFPRQSSQMMQSLVRDADQIGVFPRWPAANFPAWVMSGDAPAILISNGYAFGAHDFDSRKALAYMVKAATVPETDWPHNGQERLHLDEYLSKGYVSLDGRHDVYSASATLDFNNADFAVSRMASALGDRDDAQLLLRHAQFWRNLFDKDSGLIRPRESDGSFVTGWDPDHYLPRYDRLSALGFEEGSAYQYTYTLPFNYAGLIQAMGGREAAEAKFDRFFEKVAGWNTTNYTTTNEPDFGDEYVYDWLGEPWKTQQVVSRALDTFTIKPDGLPGNDDLGATSGLYVWDSLGLYPAIPGVGGFAIGAPLFPRSVMRLGDGRTIEIVAKGKGIYVQSLMLNGREHGSTWLPLGELSAKRNLLVFTMGETPNKAWGSRAEDAPPSFDIGPEGGPDTGLEKGGRDEADTPVFLLNLHQDPGLCRAREATMNKLQPLKYASVVCALGLCGGLLSHAQIRLPNALSDHAVLQRDRPIQLWGWASPAARLTVSFHNQQVSATADRIGEWTASLMPEAAGGPYTLTVRGDGSEGSKIVSDLLVGDVWLASGQSNMEMPLQGFDANTTVKDGAAEIKAADYPQIRLLHVNHASSDYPLEDVKDSWTTCTPETAANFSAIAYFFGREISAKEHVPIGLIDAAWGGVPVDSFISLEGLSANSAVLPAIANRARYAHRLTTRNEVFAADKREDDEARAARKPAPKHDWIPEGEAWLPAGPYNAMIAPFTGFSLRGFLWYQGETDTDWERAPHYRDLFQALISDWRSHFAQGDLPFLYVQLTSFNGGTNWGVVRDAQRRALGLANTAMAVTLDVGQNDNIHPPDKQTVAARLALAARHTVYGKDVPYLSPLFREATKEPGGMRVWFDHAEMLHTRGGKLTGFELAGEDRHFVAADATIDGASVVVRTSQVAEPRYVRYAWDGVAPPSLYNQAELPASTFTSEGLYSPQ